MNSKDVFRGLKAGGYRGAIAGLQTGAGLGFSLGILDMLLNSPSPGLSYIAFTMIYGVLIGTFAGMLFGAMAGLFIVITSTNHSIPTIGSIIGVVLGLIVPSVFLLPLLIPAIPLSQATQEVITGIILLPIGAFLGGFTGRRAGRIFASRLTATVLQ